MRKYCRNFVCGQKKDMRNEMYGIFLLLCVSATCLSQELFLRTYDFGTVENSYQIMGYNGRIFLNTATFCGNECSFICEIDGAGNILWKTDVSDIDIASSTMVVINDTITITGNNDPQNTLFRMAHFDLDGNKLGETLEIKHSTDNYESMFQLTTTCLNGKYVVSGTGIKDDSMSSLVYVVDKSGQLDTLIELDRNEHISRLWHSYVDAQGRLTTYHQIVSGFQVLNIRKIYKFDENYEIIWSYTSEHHEYNEVIPRGCELQDGRTVLSFANPQGGIIIHSVRAINSNGTVDWQHDYPVNGSKGRYILRLKTLDNGDILGSGIYSELNQTPRVSDSPWLFRMSPDGELLWERTYFEIDSITMDSRLGALYDFIELSNGDIMAVGYFQYSDGDVLIMRVDSNGCLDPTNCKVQNIITSSEDLSVEKDQMTVYPNPAGEILNIEILSTPRRYNYEIVDLTGVKVNHGIFNGRTEQISIGKLTPGLYLVNVYSQGHLISAQKFIKQ
jgi:Secretion system C-terminal sorting domain